MTTQQILLIIILVPPAIGIARTTMAWIIAFYYLAQYKQVHYKHRLKNAEQAYKQQFPHTHR